jgi:hypothetical protein
MYNIFKFLFHFFSYYITSFFNYHTKETNVSKANYSGTAALISRYRLALVILKKTTIESGGQAGYFIHNSNDAKTSVLSLFSRFSGRYVALRK